MHRETGVQSRRVCPDSSRPRCGPSLAEPSICRPVGRPSVGFADDKVHWKKRMKENEI